MALVPFGKPRKVAGYTGASSPRSEGRMPRQVKEARSELADTSEGSTGSTKFEARPAPPVDGALVSHDRDYPRAPREKY